MSARSIIEASALQYPPIDDEFGCLTHAEKVAAANPQLRYVEGWTRLPRGKWGAHAWCATKAGRIVDPYFEHKFGAQAKKIEYREVPENESPFR